MRLTVLKKDRSKQYSFKFLYLGSQCSIPHYGSAFGLINSSFSNYFVNPAQCVNQRATYRRTRLHSAVVSPIIPHFTAYLRIMLGFSFGISIVSSLCMSVFAIPIAVTAMGKNAISNFNGGSEIDWGIGADSRMAQFAHKRMAQFAHKESRDRYSGVHTHCVAFHEFAFVPFRETADENSTDDVQQESS